MNERDPNLEERQHSATTHPRSIERADERQRLVTTQLANRNIRDARVLTAMADVPRHWFVPPERQSDAYEDRPLPIGHDQTISQPYIVAHMTEQLALKPTDRVLEIGTGSGYQTAVLSELCADVFTIEIIEPLARQAQKTFEQHGYENIHCRIADGHLGWPAAAPFDAIIVTCAPEDIPPALIAQLAIGGRLCIPVGPNNEKGQVLVLMTKRPDGTMHREDISMVRFVPMTGGEQPNG